MHLSHFFEILQFKRRTYPPYGHFSQSLLASLEVPMLKPLTTTNVVLENKRTSWHCLRPVLQKFVVLLRRLREAEAGVDNNIPQRYACFQTPVHDRMKLLPHA